MHATLSPSPIDVHWVVAQVQAGVAPEDIVRPLIDQGWAEADAIEAVEQSLRAYVGDREREQGLPPAVPVPAPVQWNGAAHLHAADRDVGVLAHLVHPQIIVFGNVLAADECERLIALARSRLVRSTTVDPATGGDLVHEARTSEGMYFVRGDNPLCERIEARLAALTGWPVENGEGLQVLRYGVGAQYRPHHDYFAPAEPGSAAILARGGQRVASLVMYLNTTARGGATVFPEAHFQVSAVRGNGVFFSYDRAHPVTRTLHGGAPVLEGEKWIATKWLRERRHD